jgi:hypothetical protein
MKFLFMQRKRFKAIHRKLRRVLGEAAVGLVTVKRWRRRFKDGNSSLDDEFRSGRPRSHIGEAISRFLSKEPFLSAQALAKKLATSAITPPTSWNPSMTMIMTMTTRMKALSAMMHCVDSFLVWKTVSFHHNLEYPV